MDVTKERAQKKINLGLNFMGRLNYNQIHTWITTNFLAMMLLLIGGSRVRGMQKTFFKSHPVMENPEYIKHKDLSK